MIDHTCCLCHEYAQDVYTLSIRDEKDNVRELSGHMKCVSQIQKQINSIKKVDKLSVQEIMKQIGFSSK
jgi:hypothetical protein